MNPAAPGGPRITDPEADYYVKMVVGGCSEEQFLVPKGLMNGQKSNQEGFVEGIVVKSDFAGKVNRKFVVTGFGNGSPSAVKPALAGEPAGARR